MFVRGRPEDASEDVEMLGECEDCMGQGVDPAFACEVAGRHQAALHTP